MCAKNEVQNAVPNRSIDLHPAKSIFLKGCVRPLFAHFLQFSICLLFVLSLESISHSVFSKNGVFVFSRLRFKMVDVTTRESCESCESCHSNGYGDPGKVPIYPARTAMTLASGG